MSRIIFSYAFLVVDFRIHVNQILKENCLLKKRCPREKISSRKYLLMKRSPQEKINLYVFNVNVPLDVIFILRYMMFLYIDSESKVGHLSLAGILGSSIFSLREEA